MKRLALGALLLVLTGALAVPASAGGNKDEMLAAATALDRRFVDAFNKGDVDAMAAYYWNDPNVVVYLPDMMEAHGSQAVREALAAMVSRTSGEHLEMTERHAMVAGNVVIVWARWHLTTPSKEGAPQSLYGRSTEVLAKRDGKWVCILDHASVPLAPPASETTKD